MEIKQGKVDVMDPESAENDFDKWAEAMDLDFRESRMNADSLENFLNLKDLILSGFCRGSILINEECEIVFTPENKKSKFFGKPIVFHESDANALMAQDRRQKGQDVAKMWAVLGAMCKIHPSVFSGMHGRDTKICIALFTLLMG